MIKQGSNNISKIYIGTNAVQKVYLGTNLIWTAFETEYQAVLNYATSLGYSLPSASQQTKQNTLLKSLKDAGIWSKLDSFAVFATDAGSNFALIDWKRLTLYTAVNSPTFTSNSGFTGNGTSSYINTNFNPFTNGVNYTLNNASRYLWNKSISLGSRYLDGSTGSTVNALYSNNSTAHRINTSGTLNASVFLNTTGLIGINRTSSTAVELFDDTSQFSRTSTSTSILNANQTIFRAASNYSTQTTSMYSMGASLMSENTSYYNAMNTYLTSL